MAARSSPECQMTPRTTLFLAALSGALAVILGAFAAHGLRGQLEPRLLEVFHTGVSYQFYHVGALLAVGLMRQREEQRLLRVSAWLFLIGMLLFSGSLYLLALTGVHYLGLLTPIGGVSLLLGWLTLAAALMKVRQNADTAQR